MQKVRLAVLGVGSWTAVNHLPAIEGRDDIEWVAAVDPDPEIGGATSPPASRSDS